MMGKIVIIDDCLLEAEELRKQLNYYFGEEEIYIKTTFDHEFIKNNVIDILFLDIRLKEENGIAKAVELKQELFRDINVVFYTNYDTYMQEAMRVRPIYYIRKKYLVEDLKILIEILEMDDFFIRRKLNNNNNIKDIMYISSRANYAYIHYINDEPVKERIKLDELENILTSANFVRCHKSYLINLKYAVTRIKDKFLMKDGVYIRITRKYHKNAIMKWQQYTTKTE